MIAEDIKSTVDNMRAFYREGHTLPKKARREALLKLRNAIQQNEEAINAALKEDLGKSADETYMTEIGLVLSELTYMLKHLGRYMKPHTVPSPMTQFHARSFTVKDPYGVVLILSPWNYPFMLTVEPLVDAIAAGNCVCVKPSAYSPATSAIIQKVLSEAFPPEWVSVITGGRSENTTLLHEKFDLIFFTGSKAVGHEVLRAASENLTPAILELGGKSPCIIDSSANLKLAAKRIAFGKYLNCGQTCVAPDYILCDASVKEEFVAEFKKQIATQFGENALENPDYGKIINEKHFLRILSLIDEKKVIYGGHFDKESLRIEPTVMDQVTREDAVMGQEIFGPVMPILTYEDFDAMVDSLKDLDKPLALYIFASDKKRIKKITTELSYGGGCINDVVLHLATSEMAFGGVGASGMGAYHGRDGFNAFSHSKSILDKKTWIDMPMRYQPYKSKLNRALLRFFLK